MSINYKDKYKGYKILSDTENGYECNNEILDKSIDMVDYVTAKHNKVLVTRMDFTFPQDKFVPKDNKTFSRFSSAFIKDLKRQGLDPHYVAVREQSKEKHQHYHMAVFLDGNKVQFPHKAREAAVKHWGNAVQSDKKGLVDFCDKSRTGEKQPSNYVLRRGAEEFDLIKGLCIERLSYLAKKNTKGSAPKHLREVFSSRIPKDKG